MTAPHNCTKCPALCGIRTQVVNGKGGKGGIFLVGQNPNYYADRDGHAFGGRDGKLLAAMCDMAGVPRSMVYRTNAIRCITPGRPQRKPSRLEIENCRDYLLEEIRDVQPAVIMTLGETALTALYTLTQGQGDFDEQIDQWETECTALVQNWEGEFADWQTQNKTTRGKRPLRPKLPHKPRKPRTVRTAIKDVAGHTMIQPDTGIPLIPTWHPSYIAASHWEYTEIVGEHFKKALRIANGTQSVGTLASRYPVVKTFKQLEALRDYLIGPSVDTIWYDTETTGLDWQKDEIISISFAGDRDEGFVVPLMHNDGTGVPTMWPEWNKDITLFADLLRDIFWSEKDKGGHNQLFDRRMIERNFKSPHIDSNCFTAFGIKIRGKFIDTELTHHAIAESLPHNMTTNLALWTDMPFYEGGFDKDLTIEYAHAKMKELCNCQHVIPISNIMAEAFAEVATSKNGAKHIHRLRNNGNVPLNTNEIGSPTTETKSTNTPSSGTSQILTGLLPTGEEQDFVRDSENTSLPPKNTLNASWPKTVSASCVKECQTNHWLLTTTMLQDEFGVSSVPDAILHSVNLGILQKVYNAHSITCPVQERLGLTNDGVVEHIGAIKHMKKNMAKVPDSVLWPYSAADSDGLPRMHAPMRAVAESEGNVVNVLDNITIPMLEVCRAMEENGFPIDMDYFHRLCQFYAKQIEYAELDLWAAVPSMAPGWSYYNPKLLRKVLFQDLKLPRSTKKTKSSRGCEDCDAGVCFEHDSTGKDALLEVSELCGGHPAIDAIIKLKNLSKRKSVYLDGGRGGMLRFIRVDGRIHPSFKISRAETGRLASENPNAQNIPNYVHIHPIGHVCKDSTCTAFYVDNFGINTNNAFHDLVKAGPGKVIVNVDWAQLEIWVLAYRILADIGDRTLLEVLESGVDIHTWMARKMYPTLDAAMLDGDWRKVHDVLRRRAKTANFGIGYCLTEQGFANREGCTIEEAEEVFRLYKSIVPIDQWFKFIRQQLDRDGYIENIFGRRRHITYLKLLRVMNEPGELESAYREGINFPIQSGGSDLHSIASFRTLMTKSLWGRGCKMILSIHDSLTFEADAPDLKHITNTAWIIKKLFEDTAQDTVLPDGTVLNWKVPVEVEWGPTWGQMNFKLDARGKLVES